MQQVVTHPLSARLVLLAAAAALALSLVFAVIVAEQRDRDGGIAPAGGIGAFAESSRAVATPAAEVKVVRVEAASRR